MGLKIKPQIRTMTTEQTQANGAEKGVNDWS